MILALPYRKGSERMTKKTAKVQLGKLKFDKNLNSHCCDCRLSGHKVGVTIDASEASADVKTFIQTAEEILSSWETLQPKLCKIARDEIISSGSADDVPKLKPADVIPFSFILTANDDGEVWYSFGLNVPSVLDDDEYVDICREVNGAWTTSEVCCTE
jgi:hypothetical protein